MSREIGRNQRTAVASQIAGAGAHDLRQVNDLARDQRRVWKMSSPHRDIDILGHKVDHAVCKCWMAVFLPALIKTRVRNDHDLVFSSVGSVWGFYCTESHVVAGGVVEKLFGDHLLDCLNCINFFQFGNCVGINIEPDYVVFHVDIVWGEASLCCDLRDDVVYVVLSFVKHDVDFVLPRSRVTLFAGLVGLIGFALMLGIGTLPVFFLMLFTADKVSGALASATGWFPFKVVVIMFRGLRRNSSANL